MVGKVHQGLPEDVLRSLLLQAWVHVGPRVSLADMRSLFQQLSTSTAPVRHH